MKIIVIGASSGGPKALQEILTSLPKDLKAIVIVVQHMPAPFTKSMVKRFSKMVKLPVSLIENDEHLVPKHVYFVPGDKHFFIMSPGMKVRLLVAEGLVSPSIDMGFTSVAEHFGPETIGVVLTGMGNDGVMGAKAIKQLGGRVIVQDESTSAIYGMPKAVQIAGFADEVLALEKISSCLERLVNKK